MSRSETFTASFFQWLKLNKEFANFEKKRKDNEQLKYEEMCRMFSVHKQIEEMKPVYSKSIAQVALLFRSV